jgi:hypothetical protein
MSAFARESLTTAIFCGNKKWEASWLFLQKAFKGLFFLLFFGFLTICRKKWRDLRLISEGPILDSPGQFS